MEIKKTLQIGAATVEITMSYNFLRKEYGNMELTNEIVKLLNVEMYVDNKLITSTRDENFIYLTDGKARVGNMLIKESTGAAILEAIATMHNELSTFVNPTATNNETSKEIEIAKKIMAEVEIRKTEILSDADEKQWRINYNNINNEGGEGYVSRRATLEDIKKAKSLFKKCS